MNALTVQWMLQDYAHDAPGYVRTLIPPMAMLLGSTLAAQAEPINRDKWIAQTGKASKSCLAKFRQKFGEDKGHNYSRCVTDQTNKAIDDCVGSGEFSSCVLEKSLRVLEVCDLSSC